MNKNKVILISIDAMRPDGFLACKNPYAEEMLKKPITPWMAKRYCRL